MEKIPIALDPKPLDVTNYVIQGEVEMVHISLKTPQFQSTLVMKVAVKTHCMCSLLLPININSLTVILTAGLSDVPRQIIHFVLHVGIKLLGSLVPCATFRRLYEFFRMFYLFKPSPTTKLHSNKCCTEVSTDNPICPGKPKILDAVFEFTRRMQQFWMQRMKMERSWHTLPWAYRSFSDICENPHRDALQVLQSRIVCPIGEQLK